LEDRVRGQRRDGAMRIRVLTRTDVVVRPKRIGKFLEGVDPVVHVSTLLRLRKGKASD
jgi:hypothetical protein